MTQTSLSLSKISISPSITTYPHKSATPMEARDQYNNIIYFCFSERRRWRNFVHNESESTAHGGVFVHSLERSPPIDKQKGPIESTV